MKRARSYRDLGWWLVQVMLTGVTAMMLFGAVYLLNAQAVYRLLADSFGGLAVTSAVVLAVLVRTGKVPRA